MSDLCYPAPFDGFGPSAFLADAAAFADSGTPAGKGRLRSQLRLLAPRQPGVYGMVDAHHDLIYLGKAKNLRARLLSYFRPRSRAPKAGKIIAHAKRVLWQVCPGEFASLLRELELIRRWRPNYNVQGQPLRRRQTFVCLGRSPAPHAFLASNPPRTATLVFGPIPGGRRATEAVRRVNDVFQLRDCPQAVELVFPDQGTLFPQVREAACLRMELSTCLGPCTGTCTRDAYRAGLDRARAFLAGAEANATLAVLEQQMTQAAHEQHYERAAALRDRLAPLRWLAGRLEKLRYARQTLSCVYPVAAADGRLTWYLIHGARTLAAVPAPTDNVSRDQARRAIEAAFRQRPAVSVREAYEHADGMMLVLAWFRKHPAELQRTLTPDAALALCKLARKP
jgi:excinuclease ABC subunit C